jgi:hypothetical protein
MTPREPQPGTIVAKAVDVVAAASSALTVAEISAATRLRRDGIRAAVRHGCERGYLVARPGPAGTPRCFDRPVEVDRALARIEAARYLRRAESAVTPYGVTLRTALSRRRGARIDEARAALYAALWDAPETPTASEIGRLVGRDHTTVAHGIEKHQARTRGRAAT